MTYVLVMGGLSLSLLVTLGWGAVAAMRWLVRGVRGHRGRPSRRAAAKPARPKASRTRPAAAASGRPRAARAARSTPAACWPVTRWLASWRTPLPLGLLTLLLYAGSRLAEYGMAQRPQSAPEAFHGLVSALGWAALVMLGVACVNLLASWRCRSA